MLIKSLIITNLTRLHSAFKLLSPVHKKRTYAYKIHTLTWPIAWLWLDLDLCMWDIWLYAARLFTPFSAHLLLAVSASSGLFIFWGVFFFLLYAAIFTKQRPLHLYTAASPRGSLAVGAEIIAGSAPTRSGSLLTVPRLGFGTRPFICMHAFSLKCDFAVALKFICSWRWIGLSCFV